MTEWGLSASQLAQTDKEPPSLWPENETPVLLFDRMLTQWRMGFSGPVGLDYSALPLVAQTLRIGRRALREAFDGLRVCEAEALRVMRERR